MGRGRGRRQRGRGVISRVEASRRFVSKGWARNEQRGMKLVPRADPPAVLPTQWNAARLVFYGVGAKSINDSTIVSGVQTQLGFTVAANYFVVFKIREARVWLEITPGNPLKAPLQVRFHSVFGEDFLSVQADYGGDVRYARCGFRWPVSDQNATLDANGADYVLVNVQPTDTTQNWVAHIDVLWSNQKGAITSETLDGVAASFGVLALDEAGPSSA